MPSDIEILVLGATGMLGHKMFQRLGERFTGTYGTIRGSLEDASLANIELFRGGGVFEHIDAADSAVFADFLTACRPKVIVNCAGIVKQKPAASDTAACISINALLPHQLIALARKWGGRVLHFSTDCVFSGRRGHYTEKDVSDAEDLYGRNKALGELTYGNSVTLRTSMIGRELHGSSGLLEWFLAQNHSRVRGYCRAFYSGTTTNRLATVVGDLIAKHPQLTGLYQVTAPTISKFNLLSLARDAYGLDVEITPDDDFRCDRSMSGDRFHAATGLVSPAWPELIKGLAGDQTPYKQWRMHENVLL